MDDKEKIKLLEKQVELLEKIVELQKLIRPVTYYQHPAPICPATPVWCCTRPGGYVGAIGGGGGVVG